MGNYDLLVGLHQDRLNLITQQAYASSTLKRSLFSSSESGQYVSMRYTLDWSFESAPKLSLRPPTAAEWQMAVKEDGKGAAPQSDAFIVEIEKLSLKLETSGDAQGLDTMLPVQAICSVKTRGNAIAVSPLAVIVNLSRSTALERFVISKVLIPELLRVLDKTLSGIQLPRLSFSGVSLTSPTVGIKNEYLLTAFNLVKDGVPTIDNTPIPSDPFFSLLSRELLQNIVSYEVRNNIQGKDFSKSGSEVAAGFAANYHAFGKIKGISVSTTANPTKLRANASIDMSVSAGIDTPIGEVIDAVGDAGKAIGDAAEDVGKVIINPDTWNPSKW